MFGACMKERLKELTELNQSYCESAHNKKKKSIHANNVRTKQRRCHNA